MDKIILKQVDESTNKCELIVVFYEDDNKIPIIKELTGTYSKELQNFIDDFNTDAKYLSNDFQADWYENIEDIITDLNVYLNNEVEIKRKSLEQELEENYDKINKIDLSQEELLTLSMKLLANYPGFYLTDEGITYKNSNVIIPNLLLREIIKADDCNPFVKFWIRLCSNPLSHVKETLFDWIVEHGIKVSEHGLLIGYRGAVKVSSESNLPIQEMYWKCKAAKKGVTSHGLVSTIVNGQKKYAYRKLGIELSNDYSWESDKSLEELFSSEVNNKTVYTHHYTRSDGNKLYFELNSVYADKYKVNSDPTKDCASGLHFGNTKFGISGFGDSLLGVLVCPSNIVSVPYSSTNKARATEIFPFVEFDNYESLIEFHESGSIIDTEIKYLSELDKSYEDKIESLKQMKRIILDYDTYEIKEVQHEIELLNQELKSIQIMEIDNNIDMIKESISNRNQFN